MGKMPVGGHEELLSVAADEANGDGLPSGRWGKSRLRLPPPARGRAGSKESHRHEGVPAPKRVALRLCSDERSMDRPNSSDQSFSKAKRLTQPAEFTAVKFQGRAYRGALLILGVRANKEEKAFRVGFVTSKRLGGAVVRNRVRRRLRDIVRREQARLRPGFWFVVVARPAAARATHGELKDEWLRLAERASILAP